MTDQTRENLIEPTAQSVTYGSYLKVKELLGLQNPLTMPEQHDETLFIIIHQVYELWFKQILHELDAAEAAPARACVAGANNEALADAEAEPAIG